MDHRSKVENYKTFRKETRKSMTENQVKISQTKYPKHVKVDKLNFINIKKF